MRTFVLSVLLTLCCAGSVKAEDANPPVLPNHLITPGIVLTTDSAKVCTPGYASSVRSVSETTKKQAYEKYSLPYERGWGEVDHLISLELGGSNDIKNLWPEKWHINRGSYDVGARTKDRLENELHKEVCDGDLALTDAQREIAGNWIDLYQKNIGELPQYSQAAASFEAAPEVVSFAPAHIAMRDALPTVISQPSPWDGILSLATVALAFIGVLNLVFLFAEYYHRRSLARPDLCYYDVRKGPEPGNKPPIRIVLMNIGDRPAYIYSTSLLYGDKDQAAVALAPSVVPGKEHVIFEMRDAQLTMLQSYIAANPTNNKGILRVTFSELNGSGRRTNDIPVPLYVPYAATQDTTLAYWTGAPDSKRPSGWT